MSGGVGQAVLRAFFRSAELWGAPRGENDVAGDVSPYRACDIS